MIGVAGDFFAGSSGGATFTAVDGGSGPDLISIPDFLLEAPTDCSQIVADEPSQTVLEGDIVVTDAPARRMVGKGSVDDGVGRSAAYAYILPCDEASAASTRFLAQDTTSGAGAFFRLTSVASVECFDDPNVATPASGFDTQTGSGTGTFGGSPGWGLEWKFVDGGAGGTKDRVRLILTATHGEPAFDSGNTIPPGKFPGSTQTTGFDTAQLLP